MEGQELKSPCHRSFKFLLTDTSDTRTPVCFPNWMDCPSMGPPRHNTLCQVEL